MQPEQPGPGKVIRAVMHGTWQPVPQPPITRVITPGESGGDGSEVSITASEDHLTWWGPCARCNVKVDQATSDLFWMFGKLSIRCKNAHVCSWQQQHGTSWLSLFPDLRTE